GRQYTVSIALPGSIVDNAQSAELRTYLAGQIARAAAVFNVDEIVIYDDQCQRLFESANQQSDPHLFLSRVLQYLETPQYLRRALFPMHPDLRYARLLNPLDCPHHVRQDEPSPYREGVTLPQRNQVQSGGPVRGGSRTFVNCGLRRYVMINRSIQPNVRVTVKMDDFEHLETKNPSGTVVSPRMPREKDGIYWGYQIRLANSISQVFSECPYPGGYDLKIGTSERGDSIDETTDKMPAYRHLLVVFGGVIGIEPAVDADQSIRYPGEDSSKLFDLWLNTCPNQGSRTIRTEVSSTTPPYLDY
ncbi:putative RNA methyltransferase, partial [Dimargaris cristalligena]